MLTVRRDWQRPSRDLLDAFRNVPTGNICDAMGQAGGLDFRIVPVTAARSFVGAALPASTGHRDVLATYASTRFAKPGDVVVCATHGYTGAAVLGDKLAGYMRNAGVVGFVTDGVVRDIADLDKLDFPVFAQGLAPNGSTPIGPGTIGLPVFIGDTLVNAGDIIVGDPDGVVVVPRSVAADVAIRIAEVQEKDVERDRLIAAGVSVPDWLDELLAGAIRYVD